MPRLPPSQNLETLREFGLKLVRRNVWLASLSRKREKVKHMKNIIIGILVVVSVALGGLLIQKDKQMSLAEAKFKETQQSLAELQSSVTQREQQEVKLRENLEKAQVESAANAGTAAQLSIALTNRVAAEEKTNAKPANPFAEMFKNPEMRDMIREQQKTVFATMVEKNFASSSSHSNFPRSRPRR
jgi:cytoskeletal protein RodZ